MGTNNFYFNSEEEEIIKEIKELFGLGSKQEVISKLIKEWSNPLI